MNPYFLATYMFTFIFEGFSIIDLGRYLMYFVKYVRMGISLLMPQPKGTVEILRGGMMRVHYFMDQDDGHGMIERNLLVPYSIKPKSWTKVEAILDHDYTEWVEQKRETSLIEEAARKAKLDEEESKRAQAIKDAESKPEVKSDGEKTVITDEEDMDLLTDIAKMSETKLEPKASVVQKKGAARYKDCPKVDVTKEMILSAGPGKDFFGIELTPKKISNHYHCLIFYYGKRTKTFEANETIVFL